MAQCLDDYAGYTDEEINTELAEYMTDSETRAWLASQPLTPSSIILQMNYDYPMSITNWILSIVP